MKKIIKTLIISVLIFSMFFTISNAMTLQTVGSTYKLGDLNNDGKISITDLARLQKVILGINEKNEFIEIVGDINQDEKVDLTDLAKLQKVILGLDQIPDIKVKNINLNTVSVNIKEGQEYKLICTITPEYATNTNVTWGTSDASVATVDQNGVVRGISEGTAIITVVTEDGNKQASCTIKVEKVDTIKPVIQITPTYSGDIVTGGTQAKYNINIIEDNLNQFDINKIQLTGSIATKATKTVTGSGKSYVLTVTLPEDVGKIGIKILAGAAIDNSGLQNDEVSMQEDYVFTLNYTTATDATEGTISAVVGVDNSFYIKDYTFKLNGTAKSTKTTNEYTYKNLTANSTYTIRCDINVYISKTNDNTVSGYVEKQVKVVANNGVEIHYIDVIENTGAADCIFIKTANGKTIMIDAGADTKDDYINKVDVIDKYLRKEKNSSDGKNLVVASNGVVKIDYFILSHEHWDHVGGFAGLTGIHYKSTSPGYTLNKDNKINGDTVRYEFGKIITSCNATNYKEDYIAKIDGVEVKDGAEGASTTQQAKVKALYCYAKSQNKLIKVTAGNAFKIDNIILNIFYPYRNADVSSTWLSTATNAKRTGADMINKNEIIEKSTHTYQNNISIIVKLICGDRKNLLTGDAEFLAEEILLGNPSKQIKENNPNITSGLKINSSNGGENKDSKTKTGYISLISDLIKNKEGGCTTVAEIEQKYRISRLTAKDVSAQVLKKGHHGVKNTTSVDWLKAVNPNKIVVTGKTTYKASTVKCVSEEPDYRIRQYYKGTNGSSIGDNIILSDTSNTSPNSYWWKSVFGVNEDANKHCKGSLFIKTENGMAWSYANAKL